MIIEEAGYYNTSPLYDYFKDGKEYKILLEG